MQANYSKDFVAGFTKEAVAHGVSPYALAKSARDWALSNDMTERAGTTTSTTAMAVLSGLLGARKGRGLPGAVAGAAAGTAGGLLGALGGKVTGMVTPLRSAAEQKAHDSKLHMLANLLLPGVGKYNAQKRLERATVHKWE